MSQRDAKGSPSNASHRLSAPRGAPFDVRRQPRAEAEGLARRLSRVHSSLLQIKANQLS